MAVVNITLKVVGNGQFKLYEGSFLKGTASPGIDLVVPISQSGPMRINAFSDPNNKLVKIYNPGFGVLYTNPYSWDIDTTYEANIILIAEFKAILPGEIPPDNPDIPSVPLSNPSTINKDNSLIYVAGIGLLLLILSSRRK